MIGPPPAAPGLRKWRVTLCLLLLLAIYWALSLDQLALFPPIGEDEPWLAATSYKLSTQGVYGNDLFAGYYGRERHDYNHLPVYLVLQAAVFRLAGVGVWQMRFLPVACGLLVLALTFAVGRQAGGRGTGAIAAILLLGQRLVSITPQAGIPLLDVARVNRYDVLVPVLGLSAFWLFNQAEKRGRRRDYLLCGMLIGLASLTHLYGAFWLPALVSVLVLRRGRRLAHEPAPYLMLAGCALPWLPWLVFVAAGHSDFLGQMRFVAGRFDLLSPAFYVDNLRREIGRWPLGLSTGAVRPGAWMALAGLLPATLWLIAARHDARRHAAFALGMALVIQALLFATLLQVKLYNYGIAVWPLAVLALAWLGSHLWGLAAGQSQPTRRRTLLSGRGVLVGLLAIVVAEGAWSLAARHTAAAATASYDHFEARIAAQIPPGSCVLGLQRYWLGLRHFTYRSWLLPVLYADPLYYHAPLPFDQALSRVDPDVILVDRDMNRYFGELANPTHPNHAQGQMFSTFLEQHQAVLAAEVDDPTYGVMRIYVLDGVGEP